MPSYAASGISAKPSLVHFSSSWQRREDHLPCARSYPNPAAASQPWRPEPRSPVPVENSTASPATSSIPNAYQSKRHWGMVPTWQTDAAPALRSSHLLGCYSESLNIHYLFSVIEMCLRSIKFLLMLAGRWYGETATNFLHTDHLFATTSLRHSRADHFSRHLRCLTSSISFTGSKSWTPPSGKRSGFSSLPSSVCCRRLLHYQQHAYAKCPSCKRRDQWASPHCNVLSWWPDPTHSPGPVPTQRISKVFATNRRLPDRLSSTRLVSLRIHLARSLSDFSN